MSAGELGELSTERPNPRTADLDELDTAAVVARIFEEDLAVQPACAAVADTVARVADTAADALRHGGRLVYVGAGSSGRLAVLDAAELPPTFGTEPDRVVAVIAGGDEALRSAREGAEDRGDDARARLAELEIGAGDVVCGVSASGRTPFTLAALREARDRGSATAAIVCNPVGPDFPADVVIQLRTGPEVLAGSTRMKAGTPRRSSSSAPPPMTLATAGDGRRMEALPTTLMMNTPA